MPEGVEMPRSELFQSEPDELDNTERKMDKNEAGTNLRYTTIERKDPDKTGVENQKKRKITQLTVIQYWQHRKVRAKR